MRLLEYPCDLVEELWFHLSELEAQENLLMRRVADWPNMKKEARAKEHRSLHEAAYPRLEAKEATWDDVASLFGAPIPEGFGK